jgi:hypothetical protein
MQVFLSHSGDRSTKLAKLFQEWLPNVIQRVDPWISSDIKKGSLWRDEISKALENTKVGIICLTQSNLTSPWILFEAGALSKTRDAVVGTFLLDNKPTDINPPLGNFEHTIFDKEDIRKLVFSINDQLEKVNEKPLSKSRLNKAFDTYFDEFWATASNIKSTKEGKEKVTRTRRSQDEILEEILDRVRNQDSINENLNRKLSEVANHINRRNPYSVSPSLFGMGSESSGIQQTWDGSNPFEGIGIRAHEIALQGAGLTGNPEQGLLSKVVSQIPIVSNEGLVTLQSLPSFSSPSSKKKSIGSPKSAK